MNGAADELRPRRRLPKGAMLAVKISTDPPHPGNSKPTLFSFSEEQASILLRSRRYIHFHLIRFLRLQSKSTPEHFLY